MPSHYATLHLPGPGKKPLPAAAVLEQITSFLAERGYAPRKASAKEGKPGGEDGNVGVGVFGSKGRWRSILLSDLTLVDPLAEHLSQVYDAVIVGRATYDENWGYAIYEEGTKVSDFDFKEFEAQQKELRASLPPVEVPDDLKEIAGRVGAGKASNEEFLRVINYMNEHPEASGMLAAITMSQGLGISNERASDVFVDGPVESALTPERQEALEPYLLDEDTIEDLQAVLDEFDSSPHMQLADFFNLLGIDPSFSDMLYGILFVEHAHKPQEVIPSTITINRHLVFEPSK